MKPQMMDIKTQDGVCDTYVSYPENVKSLPVVILLMDAVGLRQRIFEMADRIAAEGYYVLAPNLFYRTRRAPVFDYEKLMKPEYMTEFWTQVRAVASELKIDMSKRDMESYLSFAKSQANVNPGKIGVVGYCMGGGQALRAAGNFPDEIAAAASFHAGGLVTDLETSPHLWFKNIKAEVYVGHADNDQHMQPSQMERVEHELMKAQLKFATELYKGCPHGWTMADLPAYNEEGEKKHWEKLFALFEGALKQ